VGHLRAHSGLGGSLSRGNALADGAIRPTFSTLLDSIDLAERAHALHHLNASTLCQMFKISRDQAREIVKSCGGCATLLLVPHLGVNPRGVIPNEQWQMDVTHFPSIGRLKYIHVTVDTYGGFIHASPLSGEASRDVITHTLQCMAAMGKPQIIKTDNGPGYTGTKFQQFCSQFDIKHVTGVPYNP
jgi:transposase InsO family protein